MNRLHTCLIILLGAAATFASGLYGIYHRAPANLGNEISIYIQMSFITLSPFAFLAGITKKDSAINILVAVSGIIMGSLGVWIYLNEMVYSKDPTWGFSAIVAPVFQFLCFLATLLIVAVTNRFSTN